jgi:hypothetical protein
MAHFDHDDEQLVSLNVADKPVIPHAKTKQSFELAHKRLG